MRVQLIDDESKVGCELPILGQQRYLEVKSERYGWFANANYVLPFFLDKRAIFVRMVFTTGCIAKKEALPSGSEKEFLDALVAYAKEHKMCDFIYKAQSNVVFNACPDKSVCVPWGTYEVDITKPGEELFNSFDGKSRNVIRKAKKEGVQVQPCEDVSLIYNNIKETLERQNSIHYPSYDYIENLKTKLQENVVFLTVTKNGEIQGSLILIYDRHKGYAMYAGSIKTPQTGSLDLLHYEAMLYLREKNVARYDFVGTRINIKKESKQAGIDRFKRKFNPVLIQGYAFKSIINPYKYYLYTLASKLYLRTKGYRYTDPITQIAEEESGIKSLLLLGPRYNKEDDHLVGGPIVLFEDLLRQLDVNALRYKAVDTNKKNYPTLVHAYLSIFWQLFRHAHACSHISLHSSRDYMVFGAPLVALGKLLGKETSLRKFGGEAAETCSESSGIKRCYLRMLFSSMDKLFFETKYLVSFFSTVNSKTFWFPNVRSRVQEPQMPRRFNKKFAFVSHVLKDKGIDEIIAASKALDESYCLDIYGPILNDEYRSEDFARSKACYKGALAADEVLNVLNSYDIVLLPSYKEGYPGIIIEAYSLGIPVIATSLPSISEIVDPYETGVLVSPRNAEELLDAIMYFDADNYEKMSAKAYAKFDTFRSDLVTKQFIEILEN